MRGFPEGGLIGKTVVLWRYVSGLRVPLYAANAGFFILLALFPALLLLLSLLRYTPLEVERLAQLLSGILPAAFVEEAEALILTVYDSSGPAFLGLSALTALWSASRGMYGILTGLNAIYGVHESRGYLRTRLICTLYTLVFLLVLLLTLTLHLFAGELLGFLNRTLPPAVRFWPGVAGLRFCLLLILQTGVFCLMFMFLPDGNCRFRESLPGALLASGGWLLFSGMFSLYVELASGVRLYGPVSALGLGLLWLYWCMSIVFYGAVLNVLLKQRK